MKKYIEDRYAGKQIACCRTAQEVVHDRLVDLDHEEIWIIHLTNANTVIAAEMISMGTLSEASIDCRTVLRAALLQNAAAIILAHNHPSGVPAPGRADIKFTGELRAACSLMNIKLLDHIVMAKDSFFSFSESTTIKY